MRVAILGLGLMGRPMARRLADRFGAVAAWNRSAVALPAPDRGRIALAPDPAAAAAGADVVVTMLLDGPAVADVLFACGAAAAMRPGAILIDMSSIAPAEAHDHHARLAARGVHHLDAPVSGGTAGAEAGTLAILAGGDPAVFDAARPVLEALGRPTLLGPPGAGQAAKLANQIVVGATIAGLAEGLALARSAGIDAAMLLSAIGGGLAQGAVLAQLGPRMAAGDFTPRGRAVTHLKDIRNAAAAASGAGLDLPVTRTLLAQFAALVDRHGDVDHAGLILMLGTDGAGTGDRA